MTPNLITKRNLVPAFALIALTLVSMAMASADVNLATGKAYTIEPKPDYALCTDGRENIKLTDGAYAAHWTDKNMIGWTGNRAIITIDLGRVESFGKVAVSAVGGGHAGVMFPASIQVSASTDGKRFDLIGSTTSNGLKQDNSKAYSHKFVVGDISAKARYVKVDVRADYGIEMSKYLFLSEIEVIRNGSTTLTAGKTTSIRTAKAARNFSREDKRSGYLTYTLDPFEIVSESYVPTRSQVGRGVSIFASPDEYEPATFAVHAFKSLKNVTVVASDLTLGKSTISKENIDIRILSRWNQLGDANTTTGLPEVVPELLVKDDSVISSLKGASSSMPSLENIRTDVPAGTAKQIWITVRVPANAVPGKYRSKLLIKASNAASREIILSVNVLPIELSAPGKRYGMYFLEGPKELGSDLYLKCLDNMKQHGVDFTTIYAAPTDLKETLTLYKQAGMGGPVPYLGIKWFDRSLKTVDKQQVSDLQKMVKDNDFAELLYYGIDELYSNEDIETTKSTFDAIKSIGGRTTVTLALEDALNGLCDRLDVPIPLNGTPAFVKCMETRSNRPMTLSYWMGFIENPLLNRMCTGFYLWKSGLDGTLPWAYYAAYDTDPYAESRGITPRYTALAYPTADGPIDTIEWEAFREGVDDVRYLTTLQLLINTLKESNSADARLAAKDAASLIESITSSFSTDLRHNLKHANAKSYQDYRRQIAREIIKLSRFRCSATTPMPIPEV